MGKVKLKKNDEVVVVAGKDKGKKGKIVLIIADAERVVVEGVNLSTKHRKATQQEPGQRKKEEQPIHISNVAYLEDGKPTKIGHQNSDGKRVRISRKTKKKVG